MWSHAVRDRRARLWSCVVLALCVPRLAAADPPPPPSAAGKRPLHPVQDPEIELELQAARKELLALAAREAQERRDPPRESAPRAGVSQGVPPPSMTSAAPPAKAATAAPRRTRLDWLEGLKLPDLPVRWDDRLVRLLEYYKNDARGRAIIRGLLQRKGRYEALLRAKLRAAQLPEDLSYLAMVESAHDPRARSDAGAVGIWQLMAAPAGEYGLEMSRWVDERMSVGRATDAAVLYLRDLYADLGSWPMSMAAFNMGAGALLRSIQKYNTNDFWVLSNLEAGLPFETVNYVTKVSAFAIIGHNAARFGAGDVVPDPAVELADIALPGGTSLSRVARSAGMTVEEVNALNPELKRGRLPPDEKTWDVHLPKDRLARFRERWASQGTGLPSHRTHVLRLGERLSDVAESYGTTVAKLYKLNDLVEGTSLRAGAKLRVPDVEPAPRAGGEPPTVGVLGDRFVYADRKRVFYRVADGDDLREIARFFSVTTDEIALWNRVAHDCKLQRGMFLQLYVPADADLGQTVVLAPNEVRTMVVGSEEFFNFHESQQNRQRIRYRVKPGDTLKSLAERFDLSIGSLARINRFGRDTKLTPNSEIILYVPESTAKKLGPKASR